MLPNLLRVTLFHKLLINKILYSPVPELFFTISCDLIFYLSLTRQVISVNVWDILSFYYITRVLLPPSQDEVFQLSLQDNNNLTSTDEMVRSFNKNEKKPDKRRHVSMCRY